MTSNPQPPIEPEAHAKNTLTEVTSKAKHQVIEEAKHGPISFIAAVVTLIDVGARLFAGTETSAPITSPAVSNHFFYTPAPVALLSFIATQIVIAFVTDWIIERSARISISAAAIVGLIATVLALYFVVVSSYDFSLHLIRSEGQDYSAFEVVIAAGLLIIFVMMAVFNIERTVPYNGWLIAISLFSFRIVPMFFVSVFILNYFSPPFHAQLVDVYNTRIERQNSR